MHVPVVWVTGVGQTDVGEMLGSACCDELNTVGLGGLGISSTAKKSLRKKNGPLGIHACGKT